jgi:hypothetical protein
VLRAAQAILSELHELAGSEAQRLKAALTLLLVAPTSEADRQAASKRILDLLTSEDATQDRIGELLRPPDEADRAPVTLARRLDRSARDMRSADPVWHWCPRGDFSWLTYSSDEQIPRCPTHRLVLVPEDAAAQTPK